MKSSFGSIALAITTAVLLGACSATETGEVWPNPPHSASVAFDARLAFLRDNAGVELLPEGELSTMIDRLDDLVAGNPEVQGWIGNAGMLLPSQGLRVRQNDGTVTRLATRVWQSGETNNSIQSRLTHVVPSVGEAFAYLERVDIAQTRTYIGLVRETTVEMVAAGRLSDAPPPPPETAPAEEGTSVEAISARSCRYCSLLVDTFKDIGCGLTAGALCILAGVPTAGWGAAACGIALGTVCSLGVQQVALLDTSILCNWVGRRLSRDQQWCANIPPTCSARYLNAASSNRCERCVRYSECASALQCEVPAASLCTAIVPSGADAVCDVVVAPFCGGIVEPYNRAQSEASCRSRGYCR